MFPFLGLVGFWPFRTFSFSNDTSVSHLEFPLNIIFNPYARICAKKLTVRALALLAARRRFSTPIFLLSSDRTK